MSGHTDPKLYTVTEAQSWLADHGYDLPSRRTLYNWIRKGRVNARKLAGTRVVIAEPDLRALLAGEPVGQEPDDG